MIAGQRKRKSYQHIKTSFVWHDKFAKNERKNRGKMIRNFQDFLILGMKNYSLYLISDFRPSIFEKGKKG